jgi:hypothetical protein
MDYQKIQYLIENKITNLQNPKPPSKVPAKTTAVSRPKKAMKVGSVPSQFVAYRPTKRTAARPVIVQAKAQPKVVAPRVAQKSEPPPKASQIGHPHEQELKDLKYINEYAFSYN